MDSSGKRTDHLGATIANLPGTEYRKIYVLRYIKVSGNRSKQLGIETRLTNRRDARAYSLFHISSPVLVGCIYQIPSNTVRLG